ncbi:MAG: protein translocase subunit SecF [Candidatus Marinimicrobia bacterium]|nr:protein translocase subunit SecF [Candidatus Neomarinimicrobiota bacterium]MCF7829882.1 protein translocase subunit SecF [Candidatus Neomarinimicrobiota bacterium]MCF7879155.1 protein translocase subunit SecF [Candidatus Neomarinimicrobiota bacterium]
MELFAEANYKILEKRKFTAILSVVIISIGLLSILFHNGLRLGIDFEGGTLMQIQFEESVEISDVRSALEQVGLENASIQQFGAPNEIIIRVLRLEEQEGIKASEEIQATLSENIPGNPFNVRRMEQVGPKIGSELRGAAVLAILSALLGIVLYISIRFEFKFAIAAIVALVHDILITLGVFSLLNLEITLAIIAAFLTIVGYSLNDTIVVFDRVRENLKSLRRATYFNIVNLSINQSLSRTVVTSVTTFLVVLVLYLGGGEVIKNFAFALIIGVVVGTYSSVYVASPVIVEWAKRSESQGKLSKKR